MGRRKIEIKPIKDDRNRSVTFLKRKGGLFKKAHELSVLCQVDVAVVIFSSNKKLYQYCSGDINEIISRHSYYDTPHESKGPADFMNKKDLDDDDDDDVIAGPERAGSHSSNDHPLPHHMQHPPVHLNRHTASASPPNMPKNLVGPNYSMGPRVGTPQPMTRPSSRNQLGRRNSSNLVPPNGYPATQHPPHQNGYPSYMPHQQQHQQHQHQQHQPPQPVYGSQMMQPSNLSQMQYPQYAHQQPQNSQPQSDSFLNDTSRRQSMPPVYSSEQSAPANEEPPRSEPQTLEPKRAPAKSRSMFTPIGPSDSVLAAHFGFGQESRSHSIDVGSVQRKNALAAKTEEKPASVPAPPLSTTTAPLPPPPPPPQPLSASPPPLSRNNSMADPKSAGIRPKLKVMIPSESSDAGSPSASPRGPAPGNPGTLSARPGDDGAPGVVLPPPSPSQSVGALLSAGAQGPDNPFSRRLRPEQTPISALPSRFAESILASPSGGFYNEWMGGLGLSNQRSGDNMLPSPLNFQSLQTPVGGGSAPFFKSEYETNGNKRRSPESDHSEGSAAKRPKNS